MASVHLGRLHGAAGFARTVAIKRLLPTLVGNREFVSMFFAEARLAARIHHSNVVSVLDAVAAHGELFLVMDYVHGESLSVLIKRARAAGIAVPAPLVVGIVLNVLYGLHAAHEACSERGEPLKMVHSDVSPHNVLVGVDGVARVVDFGIAKAAQDAHSPARWGPLKGKLRYMPPEQLATGRIDRRGDIYATALVLWDALGVEHCRQAGVRQELGPAVDAVISRGLEDDPSRRYATASDMAADLERAMAPASPREIGDWVTRAAGDALTARAAWIRAIEQQGAVACDCPPASPPHLDDAADAGPVDSAGDFWAQDAS
jgi:serine/threonine-protein kinase